MKFCKVADIIDYQHPDFEAAEALLALEDRNRKTWEYLQVYTGLQQLGLLNGESIALGLGVGTESLIYAFTNVCQKVVATDLYKSQNWSTAALSTDAVYEANPFPYQRDRLVVQHMDMTQVEYPDASFDFVWSCCSIEHVNNFQELHKVFQEIHRVLKPGGIAALTTEYNPTQQHSYEPNMLFTDQHWLDRWMTGADPLIRGLDLLDSIDYTASPSPENAPEPLRAPRHAIALYSRDIVITSIAFFLRKQGEFSQPYHEQWLPVAVQQYLAGCDRQIARDFQGAELLLSPLSKDLLLSPRLRVAACHRLTVALKEQGKDQEIVAVLKDLIPACQQTQDPNHLLPLAHQCKRVGLWEEAKLLYEQVEELAGCADNQVVRSFMGQADYFVHQGDQHTALTLLDKAASLPFIEHSKEKPHLYFRRASYLQRLRQFEEAIDTYSLAKTMTGDTDFQEKCNLRIAKCQQELKPPPPKPPVERRNKLKAIGSLLRGLFNR
ncbi:MAG: class I SAM-dependent methyltransferase [Drouetiella hepatica Uher 2000/2452]|jgi:SAM-dependent methyltransferase|uniref:Class I SAM-dependent methyltransferase n=1 Tax=Drouetiella hepatica Uher 2000/2452 TaxID=904376 RepID=A0A951Q854_9CYAN|nr:class I SAM-dependent methyltransferase [Drouetiella hepatica Uher 2000/2452]